MKTPSKLFLTVAAGLLAGTLSVAAQDGGPSNEKDRTGATTDSSLTSAYPDRGPGVDRRFVDRRFMGRDAMAYEDTGAYARDDSWSGEGDGILGFGIGVGFSGHGGSWAHSHNGHRGWRHRY